MKYNGKEHAIYDLKKPTDQNFMVFQIINCEIKKNFSVVILPDNYELAIGLLGEVILNDKSIVDSHGSLTYNNTMD